MIGENQVRHKTRNTEKNLHGLSEIYVHVKGENVIKKKNVIELLDENVGVYTWMTLMGCHTGGFCKKF